ncbi:MarR family transcriptional regulator [Hahella sp. KA22]|uniref:MarR family winged helix-turn-helix transcriptional regulator n=1 Tax=Hahella sp. KA22 TaxID=1628392 RepID=UPI000FDD5384|nr:MarR family transcriptional regulator [Hahella sp. KA22]AZZ91601.1 MarR family transcriptional regulator [Hahella sp. KA22]QAY54971.1 MarR family transcriptional regulator [Hahella sp. KA22]
MTIPACQEGREDQLLALDNQICFLLYSCSRSMTSLYRPLLNELGLTYPQYLAMLVLWEGDRSGEAMSIKHICERLLLDTGTVTPLLKRLQQQGLITRQRSAEDERSVLLGLTDAGRELRAQAAKVPMQLLCKANVAIEELERLKGDLRGFLDRIQQLS